MGDGGVGRIQKGDWKQMKVMNLPDNEVSVIGVRLTALSQFHRIRSFYSDNEDESELKKVVEKNRSTLENQLRMKWGQIFL